MQAWIVLTLAGYALANSLSNGEEVLTMTYSEGSREEKATMDVHINKLDQTIRYHMLEQGNLADVETLEDYHTGFAASRVDDDEACYIRKVNSSLQAAAKLAEKLASSGPQEYMGHEDVLAIPADDVEDWAGERIVRFCGDFSIYKLVKTEEDFGIESEESDSLTKVLQDERQATIIFRRCFFFFFFFKCITTTITIPTGTTIVFFLFG